MDSDSFPPGVKLTRNDLGGMAVTWNGNFIGWIHASIGNQWNAYVRGHKHHEAGRPIGKFTKNEAVRRIALAAGWREAE